MRDLIISAVIVGLFPACFLRPFVGLCVFSWLAYMRVPDLAYGFAKGVRWSFYVAILMFAGYFFQRNKGRFFLPDPRCYLMLLMALLVALGVMVSQDPDPLQFGALMDFFKIIGVALFTTGMVRTREHLRVMLWIIALSLGFYGVKMGLWGIMAGGSHVLQGPGGLLKDNNDFALAMAMAVPMLFALGWTERRPELKKAFYFALPLTVFTVGLTRSRGGFLSVVAALGVLVWRSRNRVLGLSIGALVLVSALVLAPRDYIDRLRTITTPTEEGSAHGRLIAWGIATRMATDNPFFGVGLRKFTQHYEEYALPGTFTGTIIVAHSSYFQVWAECGTFALIIYFALILSSLWTCNRVRKEARSRYFSSWIINYSIMFEATLLTFMVGASFLNRAHFDLFYHWVALIIAFSVIARREMADEVKHPWRVGSEARTGRGPVRNVQRHGFRPTGAPARPRPVEA